MQLQFARAVVKSEPIIFGRYVADEVELSGKVVLCAGVESLSLHYGISANEVSLGRKIPFVTHVRKMTRNDAHSVLSRLDESSREFLDNNHEFINSERVRMVDFDSGESGFVILYGKPSFFSIVIGTTAFDVFDGDVVERQCGGMR